MAVTVTVAGVDRTNRVTAFDLERAVNEVGSGTITFVDRVGSWQPSVWDEVIITEGATTLWRGQIVATEVGWPVSYRGLATRAQVVDRLHVCTRQLVNWAIEEGRTLSSILADIVALLDDDWPITLHPSQATGPTLTALSLPWQTVLDALGYLAEQTGWIYGIDTDDRLRMWAPGSLSSGVTWSAATKLVRTATISQQLQRDYGNAIYVEYGPSAVVTQTERFSGDGVTRAWPLTYAINQGDWPHTVYDSADDAILPVALYPDAGYEWTYELATNTLHQRASDPVLTSGQYVEVTYQPGYPQIALVADSGERTARGIWTRYVRLPDVTTFSEAQAYATATIARGIVTPRMIRLTMPPQALTPGTTGIVDLPALGVQNVTVLIQRTRLSGSATWSGVWAGGVSLECELVETLPRTSWLDFWRQLATGSATSATVSGGVVTMSSGWVTPLATERAASIVPTTAGQEARNAIRVPIDATRVPSGTVVVRCEVRRVSGSGSVTPALRTVGGVTVGTGTPVTSSTFVAQSFTASLASGLETYILVLIGSDATTEGIVVGTLEIG